MSLLLNKTIKLLNKFAKKFKKSLFWGLLLTIFFTIFDKTLSQKKFFLLHTSFCEPLCKVSVKGITRFRFIQQARDRDGSNIYREKLTM